MGRQARWERKETEVCRGTRAYSDTKETRVWAALLVQPGLQDPLDCLVQLVRRDPKETMVSWVREETQVLLDPLDPLVCLPPWCSPCPFKRAGGRGEGTRGELEETWPHWRT